MYQPGKIANPARGQLNNFEFFPVNRSRLRICSRKSNSAVFQSSRSSQILYSFIRIVYSTPWMKQLLLLHIDPLSFQWWHTLYYRPNTSASLRFDCKSRHLIIVVQIFTVFVLLSKPKECCTAICHAPENIQMILSTFQKPTQHTGHPAA